MKQTHYDRVKALAPVARAIELGWKEEPGNVRAIKHFYWFNEFRGSRLTVHFYKHEPVYVIDFQNTFVATQAIKWLEEAALLR